MTVELSMSSPALRHNFDVLSGMVAPLKLIAVIKGDAFRQGLATVYGALADRVDYYAVEVADEAVRLRALGYRGRILCLREAGHDETRRLLEIGCDLTVSSPTALCALGDLAGGRLILEIETGLHRSGMRLTDLTAIRRPRISGVYTHLVNGGDRGRTAAQVAQLTAATTALSGQVSEPLEAHVDSTSSVPLVAARAGSSLTHVRCGQGIFGLAGTEPAALRARLRETFALRSEVLNVTQHPGACSIGYHPQVPVDAGSISFTLGIGYADGLPAVLNLHDPHPVALKGGRGKVVQVHMNRTLCTLMVGTVAVGEAATLLQPGEPGLTLSAMARRAGIPAQSIICSLGAMASGACARPAPTHTAAE